MPYQKSFDIQQRLNTALRLIRTGRYSTPMLADTLGVSIPTVSRCVLALRERGFDIKSKRAGKTWRYVLAAAPSGLLPIKMETADGPPNSTTTHTHPR